MKRALVMKNRSYRRFDENVTIQLETLINLIDLAHLPASGGNKQPLKYILSYEPQKNARIIKYLGWAAYLNDWEGPAEGERPSAYIIILGDKEISPTIDCDHGIASQSILLGATELGLGGCIIHSVNREGLRSEFGIDTRYVIKLVLAIGKPVEQVVVEDLPASGDYKYWRDAQQVHHVPKRSLDELILEILEGIAKLNNLKPCYLANTNKSLKKLSSQKHI
ncbi:MAG: nitroreductase [Chloroflexi bacterium HGW-Chloroflexi-3]|nr:MAG: nitroreductase [Chloroflexi bacterium HGW-Chloroflexi-3]